MTDTETPVRTCEARETHRHSHSRVYHGDMHKGQLAAAVQVKAADCLGGSVMCGYCLQWPETIVGVSKHKQLLG